MAGLIGSLLGSSGRKPYGHRCQRSEFQDWLLISRFCSQHGVRGRLTAREAGYALVPQ